MSGADDAAWSRPGAHPAPWLHVVGGAGGTRAHLDGLGLAAERLAAAAARVEEASDLAAVARGTVYATRSLAPSSAAWSDHTLDAVLGGRSWSGRCDGPGAAVAAAALAGRLREHSVGLRRAAEGYRDAEAAATALLRGWAGHTARTAGQVLGEAGPVAWAVAGLAAGAAVLQVGTWVAAMRVLRRTPLPAGFVLRAVDDPLARQYGPLGLLGRALGGQPVRPLQPYPRAAVVEPLVGGGTGFLLGALPGRHPVAGSGVAQAAGLLGLGGPVAAMLRGQPPRDLLVGRAPTPAGPLWDGGPRTTADLLRRVEATYPQADLGPFVLAPGASTAPQVLPAQLLSRAVPTPADHVEDGGTVMVQQLHRSDGTSAWVVTVAGTQEWSPVPGANPQDLSSNLAIMAGRPDDATATLIRALHGSGIGEGEPVVLAGHSQGGLTAMRAAADPLVAERLDIAAVVTAGSPVADQRLPAGVQALHLETSYDYVPTLDGSANPDTPQRTTVHVDLDRAPAIPGWEPAGGALGAHKVSTYAGAAEAMAGIEHPSLAAFDARLDAVLGDVTGVTTQAWSGVRVPEQP